MNLKERLKELRLERNLLQKDMAKFLEITPSAYGYYEQGKRIPNSETINKLSDFFNVSVDYLMGKSDTKNPKKILIDKNTKAETLLDFIYKEKNLISDLCFFTKDEDTSIDSYFPFKLTLLREKKGVSRKYLAEYLVYWTGTNVNADDIEDFEKGYRVPSNLILKKLSEFFNVPFYAVSDSDDLFNVEKQVEKLITLLSKKNNPMKVSNTELDEEDKEYIKLLFEKLLTDIRIYFKQKYTLRKYSNPIDEELENYRRELEAEQKVETSSVSEEQKEKSKKNA